MTEKNDPTGTHSITRTLETYADRATAMPPDLVAQVEQRYKRRRRMQVSSVAVLVVAALVSTAGLAMMSRPGKAAPAPAAPSSTSAWALPKPAPYQNVASVWPLAVLNPLPTAPDQHKIIPMTMLDPTHLLAYSEPSSEPTGDIYAYNLVTKSLTTLVTKFSNHGPEQINRFAVSTHWIVWAVDDGDTFTVFKAPRTGGTPQPVTTVFLKSADTDLWAASDSHVFWSSPAGVVSLSLSGGEPKLVPGLSKFRFVDGSPWAMRLTGDVSTGSYLVREMRNVVTGVDLSVTVPPDARLMTCSPQWCVGTNNHAVPFIQKLNGSHRQALPAALAHGELRNIGGGAVYVAGKGHAFVVWDPATGRIGTTGPAKPFFDSWYVIGWPSGVPDEITAYLCLGALA